MNLPDGYVSRPATHDDVRAIWSLVCATDVEEYGEPDYDESDVVDDFARDHFDLDRDTWIVEAPDGTVVGYANAWDKQPHALVVGELSVHPDSPDLYPWLVDALSARTAEHAAVSGRAVAHLYNSEPNKRRGAAIRGAGYELVRVFRRMEAPLGPDLPSPDPAAGVRPVTPDDHEAVWAAQQASFAEHYDFVRKPYDQWRREFLESGSYRPDLWWLAEVDGEVAGILIGQAHEDKGWVKTVGVVPSARGRGLGSALLLTAFAAFRDLGFAKVGLGVDSDNTTGAMALYEHLGMKATHRYDLYERVFTRT